MSLLKANSVQIGQSATATQNFTLSVPSSPDGTIKLARGNSGATTSDILSVNSSGAITGSTFSGVTINSSTVNGGTITSGTAQASTSGTAIDFTGIPSWAKRVTVMFNGVNTSGSSQIILQIGSGSISTSGYLSYATQGGVSSTGASSTAGILTFPTGVLNSVRYGSLVFTQISGNSWVCFGGYTFLHSGGAYSSLSGGSISLSGSLDRVRITTANGTDTFTAGSINIMYEG